MRRIRNLEQQGLDGRTKGSKNKEKEPEQEAAHLANASSKAKAKVREPCTICTGFNILDSSRVSKFRPQSHETRDCKIGQEVLKHQDADKIFAPPKSRFEGSPKGEKRERNDTKDRGGKKRTEGAMTSRVDGKESDSDSDSDE